jgi:transcriptional regulator
VHPDSAFRPNRASAEERATHEALIHEAGFGMVFATTPDGPRVAHVPLLSTGSGTVQFHLSRRNELTKHMDGMTALAVVNGPEGYVSPRWYENPSQVPTWNYVALEMEGRVRRMDTAGLTKLLEKHSAQHEAQVVGGAPWTMDKLPPDILDKMLAAIVGFELEVETWRPTFKLSQNKSATDRARIAEGLEAQGSPAIAERMRALGGPT